MLPMLISKGSLTSLWSFPCLEPKRTMISSKPCSRALKSTQDPDVKRGLQHCTVNYGGSVYALQQQIVDLDNFKYKEARELAGIALENTRDCERAFIRGPTHSSPLTTRNEKLEKLSDVSDVIIALLLRSIDL